MLLIALVAAAPQPPVAVHLPAKALVRIESPAVASREQWERTDRAHRKRIEVVEEDGRRIWVFTIEFE